VSEYEIHIERTAAKTLQDLQRADRVRVSQAIIALGQEPRPHGCLKMSGTDPLYRIRIGNYRVVYAIDDTVRVVSITKIGHRREIYR
jgi:mRNA interferase RelE/StbE